MQKKTAISYEFLEDIISIKSYNVDEKIKCCNRISDELSSMNFEVSVFKDYGAPIIYAEYACKAEKSVLFYMHYDVKPAGDIKAWKTDPFKLHYDEKQNKLYARGAGDDKGQIYSVIMGIKNTITSNEQLNYNIDVLIEGDEENSSPGILTFSRRELKNKKYDMVIVFDSHWLMDEPVIYLGCRGQLDITVSYDDKLMQSNCHAGNFGGIYNGAGRYLLSVMDLFLEDAQKIIDNANGSNRDVSKNAISLTYFSTGDIHRSLIPKEAIAKIDIRYIDKKVADDIEGLLSKYTNQYRITYNVKQKEDGFFNEADSKQINMLKTILFNVTGLNARVVNYCGAYLPLNKMKSINGIKYVIPLAQADESNHAPNENISLDNIQFGTEIVNRILLSKL